MAGRRRRAASPRPARTARSPAAAHRSRRPRAPTAMRARSARPRTRRGPTRMEPGGGALGQPCAKAGGPLVSFWSGMRTGADRCGARTKESPHKAEREFSVYAIVRCGGRQEKAAVDDVLTVDTLAGEVGSSVTLPAVLVVDDGKVISDPAELGHYQITAEIMGQVAGPKINIIHYKNKTGYRRRMGHRQRYTQVKITGISAERKAAARKKS